MHSKKNASSGFTLIELLVVIAIIGLLSSVVLASLNTARSKGNDASIKSNMANILTQAAVYYDTNTQYAATSGDLCTTAGLFTDVTVAQAIAAVDSANGSGTSPAGAVFCTVTSGASGGFAITSDLLGDTYWCVDSTGVKKTTTGLQSAGDVTC